MFQGLVRYIFGQRLKLSKKEKERLFDFYSSLILIKHDFEYGEAHLFELLVDLLKTVAFEQDQGYAEFPALDPILKLKELVNKYGRNMKGFNRTSPYTEVNQNNVYLGGFRNDYYFKVSFYLNHPTLPEYSYAQNQAKSIIEKGLSELIEILEECLLLS
jgi:hypothetical protein